MFRCQNATFRPKCWLQTLTSKCVPPTRTLYLLTWNENIPHAFNFQTGLSNTTQVFSDYSVEIRKDTSKMQVRCFMTASLMCNVSDTDSKAELPSDIWSEPKPLTFQGPVGHETGRITPVTLLRRLFVPHCNTQECLPAGRPRTGRCLI